MTRKPQIAWGLRVETLRGHFIDPASIRWLRKDAVSDFWLTRKNFNPQARNNTEQLFKDGTYRFVKVQIIPVDDE